MPGEEQLILLRLPADVPPSHDSHPYMWPYMASNRLTTSNSSWHLIVLWNALEYQQMPPPPKTFASFHPTFRPHFQPMSSLLTDSHVSPHAPILEHLCTFCSCSAVLGEALGDFLKLWQDSPTSWVLWGHRHRLPPGSQVGGRSRTLVTVSCGRRQTGAAAGLHMLRLQT